MRNKPPNHSPCQTRDHDHHHYKFGQSSLLTAIANAGGNKHIYIYFISAMSFVVVAVVRFLRGATVPCIGDNGQRKSQVNCTENMQGQENHQIFTRR
jgi:hypothetical protein